jgi:tetratricopeptide (TPR) repeat protein
MKRAAPWAAAVSVWLLAASVQAQPGLWQRARDPRAAVRAKARARAEQLFDQASGVRMDLEMLRELSLGSAALLELSGGPRRDPWQAVLLGRVLLDAEPGRERQAIRLIESGVSALPASDFKRASLFDVGLGAMLSGEMDHATRAFSAALQLAWDPDDRATIHRNRGKANMLSGRLSDAVTDFRAAVRLARGVEVLALSHFGLGVALERSGDYPQGMQEIARGVAVRLPVPPYPSESVLDSLNLRWIPEYDVHYFRALAAMAEALAADAPGLERDRYETAIESWDQYLPSAEASRDRFRLNAERLRQRCVDALTALDNAARGGRRSGRVR